MMELIPKLKLDLLNGWIYFVSYLLIFTILMLTRSKEVRVRLYDRKSWTKTQITATTIGKVFSLINIILILLSPLQIGSIEFIVGTVLFLLGTIGVCVAVINFGNAPLDKPIVNGLYKISRNPQMIMIYMMLLGIVLVVGSWISLIILSISISCAHFSILGEEKRLTEQYGELYLDYKKQVPRYFLFF
ncbi:MAG: methyltransferase family protein [Promethearchaeota archaeon]